MTNTTPDQIRAARLAAGLRLKCSRAQSPASNPAPEEIIGMRINAKLTQQQAADIVYSGLRTWQQWEAGDRRMHPGLRELFLIKTGQKKL